MNVMVTGHRVQKLQGYDTGWIKTALYETLAELKKDHHVRGYSGMASGVDLWFCEHCLDLKILYVACVPFAEQADTMSKDDAELRDRLIRQAVEVKYVRNERMVRWADMAVVVWDGNKGGTHNCLQILIEKKTDFMWINPVKQAVIRC
jgi:uncharacterized phage-like protein YoqJ